MPHLPPSDAPERAAPLPPPTAAETVAAMFEQAHRNATLIRSTFVQHPARSDVRPSTLGDFVGRGDRRALEAYLLVLTLAAAEPYDVRLDSRVWARALQIDADDHSTAVSKVWSRLDERKLIRRQRIQRTAVITPLREDGSEEDYTKPTGEGGDTYFKLNRAYWSDWRETLTLPGVAMLLVALHEKSGFTLPFSRMQEWYGFSEDTAQSGMAELQRLGLVTSTTRFRAEPLSPTGSVEVRRYYLQPPFGHGGG